MLRLAFAIGFLSVFGFVAYALVLLLDKHFSKNNKPKKDKN
jgi:hypothetical protein